MNRADEVALMFDLTRLPELKAMARWDQMAEETKDELYLRLMAEERAELKEVLLKKEHARVARLIEETRTTMKLLCNYLETANELLVDCGDGEEEEFHDAAELIERGRQVLARLDALG